MNRKTLLLGVLTLCITTISLASDTEKEKNKTLEGLENTLFNLQKKKSTQDDDRVSPWTDEKAEDIWDDDMQQSWDLKNNWEMLEAPQTKKEKKKKPQTKKKQTKTRKRRNTTPITTYKKISGNSTNSRNRSLSLSLNELSKKRIKKNKDGSVIPKVMLRTIGKDDAKSGSEKLPVASNKKKGRLNSLDEYLAKNKHKAGDVDDDGHDAEVYSSTIYIFAEDEVFKPESGNDNGVIRRSFGHGDSLHDKKYISEPHNPRQKSWYEIALSVCCPGYYYEHYYPNNDDDD